MIVGILDYGFGNIGSVLNAGAKLRANFIVIRTKDEILSVDILVLPGVGSFDNAVENLKKLMLWDSIKNRILKNKPIIGICLGAQLLCSRSEEGILDGLGVFKNAIVKKFREGIRVPNMGWSSVIDKDENDLGMFYFTHSYHFETNDDSIVFATSMHDEVFPAVLHIGAFWAIQFHPEKSQTNGIKFINYVISKIAKTSSNSIV